MDAPTVDESLYEFAVDLARRAGDTTLRWFQTRDYDVDRKDDGTPVTIADRTAERFIRDALAESFPDDGILGEEEGATDGTSGRRWTIDPIDGTLSFVHGVPLYATLLAVEDRHGPAVGVIHHAALEETISAGRGLGCFHDGHPSSVNGHSTIDDAVISTSDYTAMPPDMLNSVHQSPMLMRTWADAYGYSLVATGRMEVMADPILFPWDVAPMAVIIPEAGGRLTAIDGGDWRGAGSAVATNGIIHDRVVEILNPPGVAPS